MLIPLAFLLIVPLVWMLVTSLETQGETNRFPPVLLPAPPAARQLHRGLAHGAVRHVLPQQRCSSRSSCVVSNLVFCSLAGYAFARIRFFGREVLFVLLMATLMVPFQVTMIPVFLIVKWFGDNVWPYLGSTTWAP